MAGKLPKVAPIIVCARRIFSIRSFFRSGFTDKRLCADNLPVSFVY